MSTAPSEATVNPTPAKPTRKQRREARRAQAKEGMLAPKLSRKQRQRIRKAKAAPASLENNVHTPGPSYDSPDDSSYHSSEDSSFMPSTSEQSDSSSGSDHNTMIKIRKTKPVTNPEAWLRSKQLIKPETREEYEKALKLVVLKDSVFEALMDLVPVVDNSILFSMLTRYRMMDPGKKYNFKSWARRRDLNQTRSGSAKRPPALIDWTTSTFIPKEIRLLNEARGFFLTDHSGTPLVFVLRGLISPELHDALVKIGIWFSHAFQQSNMQNREQYKDCSSPFKNCQAHFGIWNGVGQDAEFPTVSTDTVKNFELWKEFFQHDAVQMVLRIMNMVLERLDPGFVQQLETLRQTLIDHNPERARYLSLNPCYLISLAVHFNQDGEVHTDRKSLHSGWDLMQAFGNFINCIMDFPDLHTSVAFHRTDLMFGRGAGLRHQARGWTGAGRMVLVPFIERRIFGYFSSRRPQQFKPFYSEDRKALKNAIPPKPL